MYIDNSDFNHIFDLLIRNNVFTFYDMNLCTNTNKSVTVIQFKVDYNNISITMIYKFDVNKQVPAYFMEF